MSAKLYCDACHKKIEDYSDPRMYVGFYSEAGEGDIFELFEAGPDAMYSSNIHLCTDCADKMLRALKKWNGKAV